MTSATTGPSDSTGVRELAALPQAIAPGRDLWPQIAAVLAPPPNSVGAAPQAPRKRAAVRWVPRLLLASVPVLVAVTVWIWFEFGGSTVTHTGERLVWAPSGPADRRVVSAPAQVASLAAGLRPEVSASLAAIHTAQSGIKAAMAADGESPLLREMLASTRREEARVLMAAQHADELAGQR
jgi:hypothetical protein